jgi:competence protein ComEA
MERSETGNNRGQEAVQSLGFLVGLCACVVAAMLFAGAALHRVVGFPRSPSIARINPNNASASSLARLPGVGATRARAIVDFRDDVRTRKGRCEAFRCAEDLAQVKGIGPATVETMRPWLQFDPPADGNDSTASRGGT